MGQDANGQSGAPSTSPRSLTDLAALVRAARRHPQRRWSIETAATAASISPMTWRRVEGAQDVRGLTYSGIERALEWPGGAIPTYLAGGATPQPVQRPSSQRANSPSIFDATWEQLLAEVDRRYYGAIAGGGEGASALAGLEGEETAETVQDRGMIAGRRKRGGDDDADDDDAANDDDDGPTGDEDVASGGPA